MAQVIEQIYEFVAHEMNFDQRKWLNRSLNAFAQWRQNICSDSRYDMDPDRTLSISLFVRWRNQHYVSNTRSACSALNHNYRIHRAVRNRNLMDTRLPLAVNCDCLISHACPDSFQRRFRNKFRNQNTFDLQIRSHWHRCKWIQTEKINKHIYRNKILCRSLCRIDTDEQWPGQTAIRRHINRFRLLAVGIQTGFHLTLTSSSTMAMPSRS